MAERNLLKNVEEAREYYAKEFLDARRKKPTPYMDDLKFDPGSGTADPDERVLSDEQLEEAVEDGKKGRGARSRLSGVGEPSTRRRRPSRRRLVVRFLAYRPSSFVFFRSSSARSASSRLNAPRRTPCEVAMRKFFTP